MIYSLPQMKVSTFALKTGVGQMESQCSKIVQRKEPIVTGQTP